MGHNYCGTPCRYSILEKVDAAEGIKKSVYKPYRLVKINNYYTLTLCEIKKGKETHSHNNTL